MMKVLRGATERECILEFDTLDEFESFFSISESRGSFIIADTSLRLDTVFRASITGTTRTRIIRPKKIYLNDGSLLIQLENEAIPAQELQETEEVSASDPVKNTKDRIRELTVTEKTLLAMKANLAERRVLMQDTNPKVQEFLLRNPRITETEIAWLARNPMSAIPTLFSILQRKDWMSADSIRQGLYTNPKTPAHILLDRIPGMAAGDLMKMHQTKALREDVREAVKREMKKRGIRVK